MIIDDFFNPVLGNSWGLRILEQTLVVNIRFAITISLSLIVLGCENQSNTPLAGKVQGMSMAPGFQEGDVISWQPRKNNNFLRNAPIVCQLEEELVIKRVIGLPKESVRITDGDLFIDDKIIQKSPQLLEQFGLIVDDDADSWSDPTHSWIQTNNQWSCKYVSPKHISWLKFYPVSSRGVVHNEDGLRIYDDVSWLPKENRHLNSVQDIGISVVLDIRLQEGNSFEIFFADNQSAARIIVRRQGRLAVIAGRLDGQFVVAAWPLAQKRTAGGISDSQNNSDLYGLPRLWSACLNVSNKKREKQRVQSLSVGIKKIGSQEESPSGVPEMVTAEGLLVWRDIYWLSMPNKTEWIVPEKHVFVLGDCPAASRDSRQWGSIPLDAIQGTVLQRGFPKEFPAWLHLN